jgi:predicted  nucleic acid-binding Zn-ribbon protein
MEAAHAASKPLAVLESVRCLECGEIYSKPLAGGTVEKNPGCPNCGYVGWIPLTVPAESPHRFAVGPRQRRRARAR